ncbi:DUF488 domain-containing protein [Tautonia plasticadhaerens]|uniref:DUF488 domain-containing protein n=1 Tax=Tautonia plasticadhaerens TaxID=2527974 RepID=A0A518H1Z9_9BACT|nr:DUF488 domain-containing protein [Tautonia plasticadhaerens]QDV34853.1 hypothetical protein ElP_27500 [Tautonia plasticadhaerens]
MAGSGSGSGAIGTGRELWTVGYGAWPAADRADRLARALSDRGIGLLVDVRIGPCPSDLDPERTYGPRPWHLRAEGSGEGIVALLADRGIAYEWVVELGNPQRQDPAMAVLRSHLDDPSGRWPVHRGLSRLADLVRSSAPPVALLCACADPARCHRSLVAEALSDRHFGGLLPIRDVRTGRLLC